MKHWQRFYKFKKNTESIEDMCSCPHAKTIEVGERLKPEIQLVYRNNPNFRNGKLYHTEYVPDKQQKACQMCYKEWLEEKLEEGKICRQCGEWIKRANKGMAIIATSQYEDGFKYDNHIAFCEQCTNGIIQATVNKKRVKA